MRSTVVVMKIGGVPPLIRTTGEASVLSLNWKQIFPITFQAILLPATLVPSVGPWNNRPNIVAFLSLERVASEIKRRSYNFLVVIY